MRKDQTKYVRLTKSNFTPAGTAFQAVRILDHFAEQAIRTGDAVLAFEVADKMMDLASRLSPGEEEEYNEEDDESETEQPMSFGFGIHAA